MSRKLTAEQCATKNTHGWKWKWFFKRIKSKEERRRARLNPSCTPLYGRYGGWVD